MPITESEQVVYNVIDMAVPVVLAGAFLAPILFLVVLVTSSINRK